MTGRVKTTLRHPATLQFHGLRCITPGYWVTFDGRVMSISDMDPAHRHNAAAMLMRKVMVHRVEHAVEVGADPFCVECMDNEVLVDKADELKAGLPFDIGIPWVQFS